MLVESKASPSQGRLGGVSVHWRESCSVVPTGMLVTVCAFVAWRNRSRSFCLFEANQELGIWCAEFFSEFSEDLLQSTNAKHHGA